MGSAGSEVTRANASGTYSILYYSGEEFRIKEIFRELKDEGIYEVCYVFSRNVACFALVSSHSILNSYYGDLCQFLGT